MSREPLTLSSWQRVATCLQQALELDPADCGRWLDELERTEPRIAALVREIIARRDEASGFLDRPVIDEPVLAGLRAPSLAGQQIGAYQIERMIGVGGAGEVWLARRNDGRFEGLCAIKLLDVSLTQDSAAERFLLEGRVLGRLAHPNIARLIDAGTTNDGRPYLALEYVAGERIDRYCDTRGYGTRERVRLFVDAAKAVAHAHGELIIHRDIKPGNVFVSDDGTLKLLDFGIAKLLAPEPAETSITATEQIILTPEYAAPEQFLHEPPSTATDVYQLGMLLYVLLARTHPAGRGALDIPRIRELLDESIPLASHSAPLGLKTELRGDLDAILAKALHRDPKQRYLTAAAFHEDLVRSLNHEPVEARRGVRLYAFRKLIRRHRVTATLVALTVIALSAAVGFALERMETASSQRQLATTLAVRNRAVAEFLGNVVDAASASGRPVTVSDMLALGEQLALRQATDPPEHRAAMLAAIAERASTLERDDQSAQLFERAIELLQTSSDQTLRASLICEHAATLANLGRIDEAKRAIDAQLERMRADATASANCLLQRALIAGVERDARGTLQYASAGLERLRRSPTKSEQTEAVMLGTLAFAQHLNGDNPHADRTFAQAMDRFRALGREYGLGAIALRNNWAFMLHAAGMPKRALDLYDEALAIFTRRAVGEDPPMYLIGNRGRALEAIGRTDEARAAYELVCSLAERQSSMVGRMHCMLGLASLEARAGQRNVDRRSVQRLTALMQPAFPENSGPWAPLDIIAGRIELSHGNGVAARARFDHALTIETRSAAAIDALLGRAQAELLGSDAAAAERDAEAALSLAKSLQGGLPFSDRCGLAHLALGLSLQAAGDAHRALEQFAAAEHDLAATVDDDHPALVEARQLAAGEFTSN